MITKLNIHIIEPAYTLAAEVLALKQKSRILRHSSNPVCGSRKSQASSPWAKQHRAYPVLSWRNHIQGWMNVRESYSRALEQGTLAPVWQPTESGRMLINLPFNKRTHFPGQSLDSSDVAGGPTDSISGRPPDNKEMRGGAGETHFTSAWCPHFERCTYRSLQKTR